MGAMKNKGDERGSKRRRHVQQQAGKADWGTVNADVLRRTIAVAAVTGGALRFGYTRDLGAYSVGIYGLGEPITEYVRPGENVEEYLEGVQKDFEDSVSPSQAQVRQERLPGT